ncbi:MAG: alpha/beta hydrolase [Rhodobacteraceae bacterium]|nr:alpha/beta hydrolase [Paracoccaceae bacterium]
MPLETLAGFPTWWTETGGGTRRALFIHCFLTHSGAWKAVQTQLANKLKMRAFDMPGHGRSWDWGPDFTHGGDYQSTAAHIAAALIEKRADVVGHSFGATVALRLARDYPNKVRSLTLIEPVLFDPVKDRPVYGEHIEEMAEFSAAMEAGRFADAAREFDAVWGPGAPWQNVPQVLRDALITRIPLIAEGAGVTLDDVHNQTIPGALEAIDQPVLLMEGATSPPIIKATHDVLNARIRDVRRVMVAGAGHMLPITHAGAVAGEIAAFLKV